MLHVKPHPLSRGADQFAMRDRIELRFGFRQEWILRQRLVRDPATARLLPCQLLVKDEDVPLSARQPFAG